MKKARKIRRLLLAVSGLLLLVWLWLNHSRLLFSQNGLIRSGLTLLFATLILLRPKSQRDLKYSGISLPTALGLALGGAAGTATGIIFGIHQLEWVGIILLLSGILARGLPPKWHRDIFRSMFVLYWLHPLPTTLFSHLQLFMQTASVRGSAWLLQLINIRVWGDGLVLRTGVYLFEVPQWCSGMRTATTVFILSVALGILRRLRWFEIVILVFWSLLQALLLNIARISIMVALAPLTHSNSGLNFLHNSAGVVVLVSIFLVYLELLYLEHIRSKRQVINTEINQQHFENISEYPPFWKRIFKHRKAILWALIILLPTSLALYHNRTYHRAMMIGDVVKELRDQGDLETARRGAQLVSLMIPDDLDWKFTEIRLKLISGMHQQAVDELQELHDLPDKYRIPRNVLLAYSLMYLGRIDEAAAIVNKLPEKLRKKDPRVAMIMAEMALRGDDADQVAVNIVTAATWTPNAGRIRNLYPYLHIHRKWQAMADSDVDIPYNDPVQAFSILEAYMQLGITPKVAEITRQAIQRWPTDMRVLEPLYFMVLKRQNETWLNLFAQQLLRAIAVCHNPDELYQTMYKCFSLARPDLAWAIYKRIQALDPTHPTLFMSIARYGQKWFKFRKLSLGIPASRPTETLDLRPFFVLGKMLPNWHKTLEKIPHGYELAVDNPTPVRKKFLKKAVAEFQRREKASTNGISSLSLDMQYLYAFALEMNARTDLARDVLEKIKQHHPKERNHVRIALSEMYERKGNWIKVYETLRTYLLDAGKSNATPPTPNIRELSWPPKALSSSGTENLHLKPLLRLIRAQLELKMRLAAIYTARQTVKLFPYSPRAVELLTQANFELNRPHIALKLLEQPRFNSVKAIDLLEVQALFKTERFNEIENFCRQNMLPPLRIPPGTVQHTSLPPAEIALMRYLVSMPSEAQFKKNAEQWQNNLGTASPALRKLLQLWIKGYNQHCRGDLANPEIWYNCGRDPIERATSLTQLTMLLCRDERYKEARLVAKQAVATLPSEPILWQILISLSNADPATINQARRACPNSPDIWLAQLVSKTKATAQPKLQSKPTAATSAWLDKMIKEAIDKQYPPAFITRAGEYLWRNHAIPQAVQLAHYVTDKARGLLPAYIFAMQCALYKGDEEWALDCTRKAIKSSLNPLPEFYKSLVLLQDTDGILHTDDDTVNALRNLRVNDPDNPLWAQMLGYIRFKRGGWEIVDALYQMQAAIQNGSTNYTAYLVASEASRLLRNTERAIDILHDGLRHNPDNKVLINNLAYTLAQSPAHIKDAVAMIPRLKQFADEDKRVNDTLIAVYIEAGQLQKAHKILSDILATEPPGTPAWFRAKTRLAELAWRMGHTPEAISILHNILQNLKKIPEEDVRTATELLAEIQGTESQKTSEDALTPTRPASDYRPLQDINNQLPSIKLPSFYIQHSPGSISAQPAQGEHDASK